MKSPAARTCCRKTRRSSCTVLDPTKPLVPVWHSNFRNLALHACDLCRAAFTVGRILAILWSMPPMLHGRRRCVEALPDKVSFHVLLGLTDIFRLAQIP